LAKKKKKTEKPAREYTRRQLSQWQRQKRRHRITLISGISVITAVILIVLVGWYLGEFRPMNQTVIRVNDTKFKMSYYIDALAVSLEGKPVDDIIAQTTGIIRDIEQSELVKQEAEELGITAGDDEAREYLAGTDFEINDAILDLAREQILLERIQNEYIENQVPESTAQAHIMAMLLESEAQTYEIRTRLANSENFTALAEEYSLHSSVEDNQGDFGWHPESTLVRLTGSNIPVDYAFGSTAGTLSQPISDNTSYKPVGYWLIKVLDKEIEEEAQTQGLLLGSEEEALEMRARLEAGEDLETLAEKYSQNDESMKQGGELGIVSQGEFSSVVDEYIFGENTELGVWSEPLRDDTVWTQGAYWLVKVEGREDNRPLDSDDRDYLINEAMNNWITSLWADPGNIVEDSMLDDAKQRWAAEQIAGS